MNLKVVRPFLNPALICGCALLIFGMVPLTTIGILQELGYCPGSNRPGLGLLFFFPMWPSAVLIIAGVIVGVRRIDAAPGKRRVA